jgi:hypothetical protein
MGDAVRPGLREARRLDTRLTGLPVPGAGDADISRRVGLGTVDDGRVMRLGRDELRSDGDRFLCMCPTSKS